MTQPEAAPPARHQEQADYAQEPSFRGRKRNRRGWPWAVGVAASGIPAGLVWWLLAPGGLNLVSGNAALASGTNTEVWLPRDLVLAGLFVFAGCLVAVLLTGRKDAGSRRMLAASVAASAAAAVLAWQSGVLAGLWFGGPQDTSVSASVAFSLRSYAVLLLWPAAVAAGYFAISLLTFLRLPKDGTADARRGV
jgi:hypothetical protein